MENNFYRERPVPGRSGVVKGGAGKLEMYVSRDSELGEVKFACKPFDELFWGLWKHFACASYGCGATPNGETRVSSPMT